MGLDINSEFDLRHLKGKFVVFARSARQQIKDIPPAPLLSLKAKQQKLLTDVNALYR